MLTFEHVPPKKAFNDRPTITISWQRALVLGPDAPTRGPKRQGGVGKHTLCQRCNNDTGRWYGKAFIDWCYQGADVLQRSGGNPGLVYLYQAYPLRILKQILTMFCSVNGPEFTKVNPELRRFLLNRESRDLPPRFRLFVYYNIEGKLRYVGTSGMVDFNTGAITVLNEISFPPFGYVLTIDSEPPDKRLAEITFFKHFLYNELATLEVRLPVLPTMLMYPGDYRSRQEILEQRAQSVSPLVAPP